ncbi:MAG: deoxycytidine triphosphate deaminase [Verrucomicrobiales bacterium]|nr:deoxycytidine triphosphate deaminase [Verrucomicrobiales bacterium]
MATWSTEKIIEVGEHSDLIQPFDLSAIKHGAYELSMGPEAFLTSSEDNKKMMLGEGEQLVIPSGQFGLLLTEEKVNIPDCAVAFISIKASIKFRGLVNVSGFHVDPGFPGRLKFSVYNAGSRDIVLQRKQRIFLIWFFDLDRKTKDLYRGAHANQNEITPDDVMRLQGEVASPGQLKKDTQDLETRLEKQIRDLEHKYDKLRLILTAFLTLAISLLAFTFRGCIEENVNIPHRHTETTNKSTNSVIFGK